MWQKLIHPKCVSDTDFIPCALKSFNGAQSSDRNLRRLLSPLSDKRIDPCEINADFYLSEVQKQETLIVAETAAPVVFFRRLHISASSQIVTCHRDSMIKSVLDTKAPLCSSEEHKANCAAYFVFIQMLNCACNDSLRDVSLIYHALGPTEKTYIDLSGVNSKQRRGS